MEAIVLAGGFGTRLREVVVDVPKPMAPIAGRPFLEILLSALVNKGFSRVILSLGYMAEKVSQYFGSQFLGMDLVYVVENKPLGTGGATRLALEACIQDHIFVLNGDTYLDLEVEDLAQIGKNKNYPIIVGRRVSDTQRYGRLIIDGEFVTGFCHNGISGPGLINAGCYLLTKEALAKFPLHMPFSFERDFLTTEAAKTPFGVFITSGAFIDIGVPEDYAKAQYLLATR